MKTCLACIYRENMGNIIGCSLKKQIITNPYEVKDCCKEKEFRDLFNQLFGSFNQKKEWFSE